MMMQWIKNVSAPLLIVRFPASLDEKKQGEAVGQASPGVSSIRRQKFRSRLFDI